MDTREQWLGCALALCRQHLAERAAVVVPDNVRVSCGFPGGRGTSLKAIGQCWPTELSADASTEIFISPSLAEPGIVLSTLLHEAIHAAVGCKAGHKGPFRKAALASGLEGKMTATVPGDALKVLLASWSDQLGIYPHATLSLAGRKKQSTRLVKCECDDCGYIVRTTAKWIEKLGAPLCPCNEHVMSTGDEETEEEG